VLNGLNPLVRQRGFLRLLNTQFGRHVRMIHGFWFVVLLTLNPMMQTNLFFIGHY